MRRPGAPTAWINLRGNLHSCHLDGREFDMRDENGELQQKSWRIATTSDLLYGRLHERRCSHGKGAHTPIQGAKTNATGKYPKKLVKAICKIVMQRPHLPAHIDELYILYQDGKIVAQKDTVDLDTCEVYAEELTDKQQKEVAEYLKRWHKNLRHPSVACMVRMLQDAKAHPLVIRAAKDFRCDDCEHRKQPAPRMPATSLVIAPEL